MIAAAKRIVQTIAAFLVFDADDPAAQVTGDARRFQPTAQEGCAFRRQQAGQQLVFDVEQMNVESGAARSLANSQPTSPPPISATERLSARRVRNSA